MKKVSKDEVYQFLKGIDIAVIASISEKNIPESAVIFYYVDTELNFYFLTRTATRKYQNMIDNPAVSLVITSYPEPITVQMEGKILPVEDMKEHTGIIDEIAESAFKTNLWVPPVSQIHDGSLVLMKIIPHWIRWADFEGAGEKEEEDCFQQILP